MSQFSESNALPCGLIRTCQKYLQHAFCKDVPTIIPGRCTPPTVAGPTTPFPRTPPTVVGPTNPFPPTGRNEVCSSKAEVTNYIFDCQQQGSQEDSYKLEKMKSCLQQKFFDIIYEHNSKDSTDEMVCAKPDDVINRIGSCKISSNSIYEFKDCLIARLWDPTRPPIEDQACHTKSGPSPNKPCIFPFMWNGETYYECPIDLDDSSQRWCSTKVDLNGKHITGEGHWGHCNSKCNQPLRQPS